VAVKLVQFPGQIGATGPIVTLGHADACENKLPDNKTENKNSRENRKMFFIQ
jgi:hypothetical protein